ncbi:MAG: serine hydrolase domain-containing protein [Acidimicrobiia bacterium]
MRRLASVELANPPGTFEYSNINYDILGLIVQTLSEMPFETYISENVLDPLEMRHSHLASDTARADGMAEGFYRWFGNPAPTGMPFSRALVPSTMTISTVEDLSHLLVAQLNAGAYSGARVLTADSMKLMQTPEMYGRYSGFAMGWHVRPLWDAPIQLSGDDENVEFRIPTILEIQGNYPTYETYMAIVPEGQWGVVVLANSNDQLTGRDVFPFENILQLILGEEATPVTNTVPVLARNLRWILLTVLVLLLASAAISWFRIRRWRQSPIGLPEGPGAFLRFVALPLVVDLAVFYVLVFLIPARLDVSPWVALRGTPDVGLLVALVVVLTLGWGLTRSALTVTTLYRKKAAAGPSFRVGS